MNEYTFKDYVKEKTDRVKNWWNENGKVVKAGVICGTVGLCYGFFKGITTTAGMIVAASNYRNDNETDNMKNFAYNENTVDDPEMLELIEMEKENE